MPLKMCDTKCSTSITNLEDALSDGEGAVVPHQQEHVDEVGCPEEK